MGQAAAPSWPLPRVNPRLEAGIIHVWRVALDAPDREARLAAILGVEEQAVAARFRFARHRRRYRIAHGALRTILARYTGIAPAALRMTVGQYGKPALAGLDGPRFNLAHAEEMALVAVAADREVGVDLEYLRALPDLMRVAARYFTAGEVAVLASLAPDDRLRAFLDGWTRKEAVMKALGLGVARPPETIEVTLAPDEAALLSLAGQPAPEWRLRALAPGPGYTGALAAPLPVWEMHCRQWEEEI